MTHADRVPDWVHMADVPPTDTDPGPPDFGLQEMTRGWVDDERGLWLGWVLLLAAFALGIVVGWWVAS